jgi:hypothetical protein
LEAFPTLYGYHFIKRIRSVRGRKRKIKLKGENNMQPTVGRMVYYKSHGTPNGEYKPEDRAAVITTVHSPISIDLCVFSPKGLLFDQHVMQGTEGGQWDWMPFQKGQAGKTEELEKIVQQQAEAPKFNCWEWLQNWVGAYEDQVGDGKAKGFYNWVNEQPMQAG